MPVPQTGAQRASSRRSIRLMAISLSFALIALAGAINPDAAAAAGIKVVVVVGPVGSSTADYVANGKRYAAQARSYGATVVELYSPNATWAKVRAAAQGAKVLIYLGHGNGSPSPYGPFSQYQRDGLGLNALAGHGNNNTRYWGEYYIRTQIKLAPNAVVILNRLCYASGNSEWGSANPTRTVAIQRVDNYAFGFLRAGARAVFAEGITDASTIVRDLFTSTLTIGAIFQGSPSFVGTYDFSFQSMRNPLMRAWMAPRSPGRYYRSVVGNLGLTTPQFRAS